MRKPAFRLSAVAAMNEQENRPREGRRISTESNRHPLGSPNSTSLIHVFSSDELTSSCAVGSNWLFWGASSSTVCPTGLVHEIERTVRSASRDHGFRFSLRLYCPSDYKVCLPLCSCVKHVEKSLSSSNALCRTVPGLPLGLMTEQFNAYAFLTI